MGREGIFEDMLIQMCSRGWFFRTAAGLFVAMIVLSTIVTVSSDGALAIDQGEQVFPDDTGLRSIVRVSTSTNVLEDKAPYVEEHGAPLPHHTDYDLVLTNPIWWITFGDRCGGTLIDPQWVLTAAHCVAKKNPGDISVYTGTYNLRVIEPVTETPTEPRTAYLHETFVSDVYFYDYDPEGENVDDIAVSRDLALLRLAEPVDNIPIMALATETAEGEPGLLAGWGYTGRDKRTDSFHLKKAGVQFYPCVSELLVCTVMDTESATPTATPGTACKGDSGGPMMTKNQDDEWTVAGVVSKGYCFSDKDQLLSDTFGPDISNSNVQDWLNETTGGFGIEQPELQCSLSGLPTSAGIDSSYPLTGEPHGGTFSGPGVIFSTFNSSILTPGLHTITYTYNAEDGRTCMAEQAIFLYTIAFNFTNYKLGTTSP